MSSFSMRAAIRASRVRQAYALLALGVICLLLAVIFHPDYRTYPLGVLVFGLGMLIAAFLNPYRLMAAAWLTSLLGLSAYLFFKGYIGGNVVFPVYIIAIGIALLAIAVMARRGYIGRGAVMPGIIVTAVGIAEYLLVTGRTPDQFLPFMLSFWLPGIGLFLIGVAYLATASRT